MAVRPRLRPAMVSAAALLVVGVTGLSAGGADAQTAPGSSGPFQVLARADAVSVEIHDGAVPLVPAGQPAVYASPSSTQAAFDSLGNSVGYASAPYPGDFAVALPTTVNALSYGKAPPLPAYPFIVTSSYPRAPSAEQTNGPYSISAMSTATGTTADAHLGVVHGAPSVLSSQAVSSATQDPKTGAMVAQADTFVDAFSVGPLLTIGEVSAHAKLTAAAGQKPVRTTSFSVGTVTIAGVKVGFTEKGLQAGPATVPGADPNALSKILASGGLSIAYLPASQTDTSLDSAGLAVGVTQDVPSQGKVTTTYVLGHVSAVLEPGAVSSAGTGESAVGAGSGSSGFDAGPVGAPVSGDLGGGPAATGGFDVGPVAAGANLVPGPSVPTGPRPGGGSVATVPALDHVASSGVYLALVGASLALFVAAGLFGGMGVRLLPVPAESSAASVLRLPPR